MILKPSHSILIPIFKLDLPACKYLPAFSFYGFFLLRDLVRAVLLLAQSRNEAELLMKRHSSPIPRETRSVVASPFSSCLWLFPGFDPTVSCETGVLGSFTENDALKTSSFPVTKAFGGSSGHCSLSATGVSSPWSGIALLSSDDHICDRLNE